MAEAWRQCGELLETVQPGRALLTPPPSIDGLQIAVRYLPAANAMGLGGDWYDVVRIDAHRSAVIVGDVVGHDAVAAAHMSQLRTIMSTLIHLGSDIEQLSAMTETLMANQEGLVLATVSITYIDTSARTLTTALAGHPPPMLAQPDGTVVDVTHSLRPVLGMRAGTRPAASMDYTPGSVFVAYTDELIERRDSNIDEGMDRLRLCIGDVRTQSSATIADHVLREFASDVNDDDDVVVIRI